MFPAAALAAPFLLTALLAGASPAQAQTAEKRPVSITWTSREDFERNAAAYETRTLPENIETGDPAGDVVLGRTTTGGKLLDTSVLVRTAEGIGRRTGIAVNAATGEAVVVWRETGKAGQDIMARRIGPDGMPRGAAAAVTDNPRAQILPRIAADSRLGTFLVVWQDQRAGRRIFARLLGRDGAPAGEVFAVSPGADFQYNPDVAWNARTGEYLVVWREAREGRSRIWGRRLSGEGKLSGTPVSLSEREGNNQHPRAAADSGSGRFLAVWSDDRNDTADIYGRFISGDGEPDGASFAICPAEGKQLFPDVVFNSSRGEYFVVWDDYRVSFLEYRALEKRAIPIRMRGLASEQGVNTWARTVRADGGTSQAPFPLLEAPWNQLHPSLAFNLKADQYLMTWEHLRDHTNNVDIQGMLLEADGRQAADRILFAPSEHQQFAPATAWNPRTGEFLTVWKSHRGSGTSLNDVYLQRTGRGPGAEGGLRGLVVDTGSERPVWEGLYWNADLPAGTALAVRTRSGGSRTELADASWSEAMSSSGSKVPSPPGRWLEIEILLATTKKGVSPALQSLTLRYTP